MAALASGSSSNSPRWSTMARLLSTVTIATLAAAPAHARQERFAAAPETGHSRTAVRYPPSAWAPTALSSTVQLGGSLTRSSATYSLERTANSATKDAETWTMGVKGANQGGWLEASVGKGAAKRKLDTTPAAVDELSPGVHHSLCAARRKERGYPQDLGGAATHFVVGEPELPN